MHVEKKQAASGRCRTQTWDQIRESIFYKFGVQVVGTEESPQSATLQESEKSCPKG